jgi:methyltransferase-like protein/SAM-dependent methyltransferase
MTVSPKTSYDEVLYPSYTHAQTHPDRLATVATLLGMKPAPVERCRVLELGCGDGSNLIPMAFGLPGSEFVGIDLAAQPVALGQEMVAGLGLKNIRLVQDSVTRIDSSWGQFDYIVAHGLYSWVPAEVRDHVLTVCCANLAPQGVAFVSYNTYPGNHLRNMVREMMLFHVQGCAAPQERVRQALALVRFLADAQEGPADEFRRFMKGELEELLAHEEGHLYHDELSVINVPLYFTQFMEHAQRHRLQYLGEADYLEMRAQAFSPATRETLAQLGHNRILREQYLDFLKCRRFRQTLLCHRDLELRTEPLAEKVAAFRISSAARPVPPEVDLGPKVVVRFETVRGARVETDFPIGKAALLALSEVWPHSVPFAELYGDARARVRQAGIADEESAEVREAFCRFLLEVYGSGVVGFHLLPPPCALRAGERPAASALARWQCRKGDSVATAFHQTVKLEDEMGRQLVQLLDGNRDRAALTEALFQFLKSRNALTEPGREESETRQNLAAELEKNLARLGRLGILVA